MEHLEDIEGLDFTPEEQSPAEVLMVEPTNFYGNLETAVDNHFQSTDLDADRQAIHQAAHREFCNLRDALVKAGVKVRTYQDRAENNSPDSIFPNNWFTTHFEGQIVIYPMKSPLRRTERREDIISALTDRFPTKIDLTAYERHEIFLEGTGSIVLDRQQRVAYCAISPRSDLELFGEWCHLMGYDGVTFNSNDSQGRPIYHTNVMMGIGTDWAIVCFDSIADPAQRSALFEDMCQTGREIIPISLEQVNNFCGNVLEVQNAAGEYFIVLSTRAWGSLTSEQQTVLSELVKPIIVDLTTIETVGGGGARCMLAEIFNL